MGALGTCPLCPSLNPALALPTCAMGLSSAQWLRPTRVLMNWVKTPTVTPNLGQRLLEEMSAHMEVVLSLRLDT